MAQLCHCSWSGRKHQLSPAAERKLVRMVKSQPKTTTKESLQWIKSCWKTGVSVHSQCVLHQQELRGCCTYRSSRSRWSTLKLQWSLLPIIWTKKKACCRKLWLEKKNWVVWPQWEAICLEVRRWGLQPHEYISTVKHGAGSIMLQGCSAALKKVNVRRRIISKSFRKPWNHQQKIGSWVQSGVPTGQWSQTRNHWNWRLLWCTCSSQVDGNFSPWLYSNSSLKFSFLEVGVILYSFLLSTKFPQRINLFNNIPAWSSERPYHSHHTSSTW